MRAVIYARYSNQKQTEQSIEGQLADCTEYAQKNNYTVVGQYIDRAMTGRNDDRDDFQRMLKDCAKGRFDTIIVWKVDRFGRNREEIALNKYKCKKHGVKVVYAMEPIPEGAGGVLMESILEGIAEYYSIDLSEKVTRGMHQSAMKCQVTGGTTPLGYMVENKKYVVNPATAPLVEMAYRMFDEGRTYAEIAKAMNATGHRSALGSQFNKNSLHKLLRNKKYIGVYVYGEIEIPGGMPQIVPTNLWLRVQKKLETLKNEKTARRKSHMYALTGKVFCAKCGEPWIGDSGANASGKKYYYYKCRNRKSGSSCDAEAIPVQELENAIAEETVNMLDDDTIAYIAKRGAEIQKHDEIREAAIEEDKAQLRKIDSAIKNLMKAIEESGTGGGLALDRINELNMQKTQLKDDLRYLESSKINITEDQIIFFLNQWKNADISNETARSTLFDALVYKVIVYSDRFEITYNYVPEGQNNSEPDCSDSLAVVNHYEVYPITFTKHSFTYCCNRTQK